MNTAIFKPVNNDDLQKIMERIKFYERALKNAESIPPKLLQDEAVKNWNTEVKKEMKRMLDGNLAFLKFSQIKRGIANLRAVSPKQPPVVVNVQPVVNAQPPTAPTLQPPVVNTQPTVAPAVQPPIVVPPTRQPQRLRSVVVADLSKLLKSGKTDQSFHRKIDTLRKELEDIDKSSPITHP